MNKLSMTKGIVYSITPFVINEKIIKQKYNFSIIYHLLQKELYR